ncbi:hypothetical protein SAMN05443637_12858 [Pseudonocardia thermophila]|jgi:hypothetical protein|uniref:Uncharacterized protein n=1 Tax=Pseudonocardia thermophila TaxID=1848 RepID=A0A1M7AK40_PSETH|nr:hypothetical protein [Pseudonocardia thermophila]SHL43151.1 hypothetical protein SAMN05443637_12858 [Pseudonocardia thermophila]
MAMRSQVAGTGRTLQILRWLSAILLLAMAWIHLYLVLDEVGGILGVLFVLNAIGGLVLAIAMVVLRGGWLALASMASLLFMAGTLLALILALSPLTFFGIRETIDYQLVPTTLVVESIGTIVLAVTTWMVLKTRRT